MHPQFIEGFVGDYEAQLSTSKFCLAPYGCAGRRLASTAAPALPELRGRLPQPRATLLLPSAPLRSFGYGMRLGQAMMTGCVPVIIQARKAVLAGRQPGRGGRALCWFSRRCLRLPSPSSCPHQRPPNLSRVPGARVPNV